MSTWLGHGVPKQLIKHYLGCFHEGVFWVRLTFELVDWVKQIALHNLHGPHSISWRPEYNKKANPPMNKRYSLCLTTFELGHRFSSLQVQKETSALPGSRACRLLDWNYPIGSSHSLACQLRILGLLSLQNHVSQSLLQYIYLFI